MDQTRFAVEREFLLVPQNIRHTGINTPVDTQVAIDEFMTQGNKAGFINRWFLIGQDEKANLVFLDQCLDFINLNCPFAIDGTKL